MNRFAVLALTCLLFSGVDAFFLNLPGLGGGCNCASRPVCPPQPQCAPPPPPAPCPLQLPCAAAPVVANNFGAFSAPQQFPSYVQSQPVQPPPQPLPQPIPQETLPPQAPRNHEYSSGPGPASAQKNYEAAKIEHKDANESEGGVTDDDDVEVDPANVDTHAANSFQAQHAPINPQEAKSKIAKRDAKPSFDAECNSEQIRKIIIENVKETPAESKRAIQKVARASIGGRVDVVCSKGKFSYIVNSEVYCEAEKNGITCFAFKQSE